MATNRRNIITHGLKGKIGNLIFRFWGNRLVVSSMPDYRRIRWSKAQTENRVRFRRAMNWARETLDDPVKRAYYSRKSDATRTPWNLAVADYLKNLRVRPPDLSHYRGKEGDIIGITPYRPLKVTAIAVTIFNERGAPVDQGPAEVSGEHYGWVYRMGVSDPGNGRGHILVTVSNPVTLLSEYFPLGAGVHGAPAPAGRSTEP